MSARGRTLTPEALDLIASRFRVLGEPLRLRILQVLGDGEVSVTEVTTAVESTQPNVSKHLRIMQEAGLISRRQAGNTVYYSVSDPMVFELCDAVCSSLRDRLELQSRAIRRARLR